METLRNGDLLQELGEGGFMGHEALLDLRVKLLRHLLNGQLDVQIHRPELILLPVRTVDRFHDGAGPRKSDTNC
jgi:hypothetical protein